MKLYDNTVQRTVLNASNKRTSDVDVANMSFWEKQKSCTVCDVRIHDKTPWIKCCPGDYVRGNVLQVGGGVIHGDFVRSL